MQPAADIPTILLEHDVWCTDQLLAKASALTTEQLHQRFDIGPGSLHDTFLHIIAAMIRWSQRMDGKPLEPWMGPEENPRKYTLHELRELLQDAANRLRATHAKGDWNAPVHLGSYVSPTGKSATIKAAAFVHVCTHGSHHRAQLFFMLKQLGVKLDSGDFDAVEWEMQLPKGL